jgi:CRP-like cAMP-binding protein
MAGPGLDLRLPCSITDVEVVPVGERQFLFLVSQTPYFALKVMRVLAQRLRRRQPWCHALTS